MTFSFSHKTPLLCRHTVVKANGVLAIFLFIKIKCPTRKYLPEYYFLIWSSSKYSGVIKYPVVNTEMGKVKRDHGRVCGGGVGEREVYKEREGGGIDGDV